MYSRRPPVFVVVAALSACLLPAQTAPKITTPKEALGFNLGDDYLVANYTQLEAYWKKLATEADRMKLVEHRHDRGRPRPVDGHHHFAREHEEARPATRRSRGAGARRGLTDEQAHALAREGKAVVWIDGGLHASETVGSQQLMELVYQMVSRTDPETMRFLNDASCSACRPIRTARNWSPTGTCAAESRCAA